MKYVEILEVTLQRFMDASPFIKALQMRLASIDIEAEQLTMTMPAQELVERMAGSGQIHGGPIAALIDTAGCFALIMRKLDAVPTINFRVDYLRPAVKTGLTARATVRRAGANFGVVDIEVESDGGELLAVGRGTFGL
jgi:uncharacterized protein (TIGR00369 family)